MSEYKSAQKRPKMGFTSSVLTLVGEELRAIKVEATDSIVDSVGAGKDHQLLKSYFDRLAHETIELYRLLGLTLVGLKKITFTKDTLPGGTMLFTFDEDLLKKLQPPVAPETVDGFSYGESERCKCSYCIPRKFTGIGQG